MLKETGLALLSDLIGAVKKNSTLKKCYGESYPDVFEEYLAKANPAAFMKDLKEAVELLSGSPKPDLENSLLDALAVYLSRDFAIKFDELDMDFFFGKLAARLEILETIFPGDSAFHTTIRDVLIRGTYQEISAGVCAALSTLKGAPALLVQSPVELPKSMRARMRTEFFRTHPFAFAEFQVNPQIIGGMRVFMAGRVADHSWLAKIQAIGALSQLKS